MLRPLLIAASLSLIAVPVWAEEDIGEDVNWTRVPMAIPMEPGCKPARRRVRVTCGEDDWCTVTDTILLRRACGEVWTVRSEPASKEFKTPTLRTQKKGAAFVPVGAVACEESDGWCFQGVPRAPRLAFETEVRSRGERGSKEPGMTRRHPRMSSQRRKMAIRRGLLLQLTPAKWGEPAELMLQAEPTEGLSFELVGRNRKGAERLTGLDTAGGEEALIVARRAGGPTEGISLKVPGATPLAEVIYEKSGVFGTAGVTGELGAEVDSIGVAVTGGVAAEAWVSRYFGAALGIEGSSRPRIGFKLEGIVLLPSEHADKILAIPTFGLSLGVVQDVLPNRATGIRFRALVQLRYLGFSVGADVGRRGAVPGLSVSFSW